MNRKLFIFAMCELMLTVILLTWSVPKNTVEYTEADDIVRIHIVANSNSEEDMSVKSKIKDYLTKVFSEQDFESPSQTTKFVEKNSRTIKKELDGILFSSGYDYAAEIVCDEEYFPVRLYDDVLTRSGTYSTVKVVLGEGEGDNWWCVAYPSLCTSKQKKVTFRSRIAEWWSKLFG